MFILSKTLKLLSLFKRITAFTGGGREGTPRDLAVVRDNNS